MTDQEPVFPKANATEPVTWGSKNALRYLEAAATALRSNATHSLPKGPHAESLLLKATLLDGMRADIQWVLDDLTQRSAE
jgi:hypothetical protein